MKTQKPEREYFRASFSGNPLLFAVILIMQLLCGTLQIFCSWVLGAVTDAMTAGIKDLLSGFSVIKSFKAEQETGQIFEESTGRLEKQKSRKRNYAGILNALSMTASLAAQMGTFLIGGLMAVRGQITPGTVLIFVNLCNRVLYPIQSVPEYLAGIRASRALVRKPAQLTEENSQRNGQKIEPVLTEGICLKYLNFGYEEGKPVLKGVNLMLDEATAALDNQTAFEVTDAILKLDGLTRIVVTHRLEERLLRQYDGIIVLRDGCVTEPGTYEDLM